MWKKEKYCSKFEAGNEEMKSQLYLSSIYLNHNAKNYVGINVLKANLGIYLLRLVANALMLLEFPEIKKLLFSSFYNEETKLQEKISSRYLYPFIFKLSFKFPKQ